MDHNKCLLNISNLSVDYSTENGMVHAVKDLSLSLKENETLGFVGETGAGKTTTALSIMRLLPKRIANIKNGSIQFNGQELTKLSDSQMRKIRGEQISMIFQDPMTSLDPVKRVVDQVMEMILLHRQVNKRQARELAIRSLEQVGIEAKRVNCYPHEFSGGMKQRVVIAIALACEPRLIIADEPTTALDVTIQAQVLDLMKNLKDQFGTSMILITHDLGVVNEICDSVAIMYFGNIVEYGSKQEIYKNPAHPYTRGLFDSIPDLDSEDKVLKEITGFPPNPTQVFQGCPFADRCPHAMPICQQEKPTKVQLAGTHTVSCFLHSQGGKHE